MAEMERHCSNNLRWKALELQRRQSAEAGNKGRWLDSYARVNTKRKHLGADCQLHGLSRAGGHQRDFCSGKSLIGAGKFQRWSDQLVRRDAAQLSSYRRNRDAES